MKFKKNINLFLILCFSFGFEMAIAQTKKPSKTKEIIVFYEDCSVYAGSTKYYFKKSLSITSPTIDDLIEVAVLHEELADKDTFRTKVPKNLVDNSKNLEGPPGPNPKMIGKKFKLIYNENDEVIEIKPAK